MATDSSIAPDIKRETKLQKRFYGVAFDEIHLQGLALLAKKCVVVSERDFLSIRLESMDEVETTRTDNPELIGAHDMPWKIGSIVLYAWSPAMQVSIWLDDDSARLFVEGTDAIKARAVFLELERAIEHHKYDFSSVTALLHPMGKLTSFFMFIGIQQIYYWLLALVVRPLMAHGTLTEVVLITVMLSVMSIVAAFLTGSQLEKAFPPVRFQGRFFDASHRARGVLKWIAGSLLVPILIRWGYDVFHHG